MRISDWSSDVCSSDLLTLRSPFAHGEGVADDARAGLQLGEQLRAQLLVQGFQQIEGDDGRLLEIGLKEILVPEADEIVDTCLFCVRAGFSNADRVYVDTHRLNAVKARRRDRDATVARAEIIEHIAGFYVCHAEHRFEIGRA